VFSGIIKPWGYAHPGFKEQLDKGIRVFELDVHYDLSSNFRVYHMTIFDQRTSCACLGDCVEQLNTWSLLNPNHDPIFVLVEPRGFVAKDLWCDFEWAQDTTDSLIRLLLDIVEESRILKPADVHSGYPSLQDALQDKGWPTLGQTRGKFIFILNNFGSQDADPPFGNNRCPKFFTGTLETKIFFKRPTDKEQWQTVRDNATALIEINQEDAKLGSAMQRAGYLTRLMGGLGHPEPPKKLIERREKTPYFTFMDYPTSPVRNFAH